MHILMIFVDGIGLGENDPDVNPFAVADMPTLTGLTNGRRWLRDIGVQHSERATLVPTDPRMGVPGRPQSATGQATILTGRNVPAEIGEHYGPRPNPPVRDIVSETNFFKEVLAAGKSASMIVAYPPRLHFDINRGKRLRSSYQQAAHAAGLPLLTVEDYRAERAMSEDWTGEGWHNHLGFEDVPGYTPREAGRRMVELSRAYDFAFFSHWFTDVVGHRGPFEDGVTLLERFDGVMAGALEIWDDEEGLIVITSDHGNMEQIGSRHHTQNDVPTLVIGKHRNPLIQGLTTLADIVPGMRRVLL